MANEAYQNLAFVGEVEHCNVRGEVGCDTTTAIYRYVFTEDREPAFVYLSNYGILLRSGPRMIVRTTNNRK